MTNGEFCALAGATLWSSQTPGIDLSFTVPRVNFLLATMLGWARQWRQGLSRRVSCCYSGELIIVITAPPAMTTQWKDELEGVGESA